MEKSSIGLQFKKIVSESRKVRNENPDRFSQKATRSEGILETTEASTKEETLLSVRPRDLFERKLEQLESKNIDESKEMRQELVEDLEDSVHLNLKIKKKFVKTVEQFIPEKKLKKKQRGFGTKLSEFILDWQYLVNWEKFQAKDISSIVKQINEDEKKYFRFYGKNNSEETSAQKEFAEKIKYLYYMLKFKSVSSEMLSRFLSKGYISEHDYNDIFYYLKYERYSHFEWGQRVQ